MEKNTVVSEIFAPLAKASFWMKFLAVLAIIGGALYCLTIVGIIIAWFPILMGVILFQAAKAVDEAAANGNKDSAIVATSKLKLLFMIYGIVTCVMIGLMIIGVIVMFAVGGNFFDSMSSYSQFR
jgi:hypothetical protein